MFVGNKTFAPFRMIAPLFIRRPAIAGMWLLLIAACHSPDNRAPEQPQEVQALKAQSQTFIKRIEKVGENIYVAIGYGLANSIMVEGKDSIVIIDCMESMEAAREVKKAFDSITVKPLKAIVYTHFHTDHTSGAKAFAGSGQPEVIAHKLLPEMLNKTASVVRHITEKRAYRMFGVFLDSNEHINCGIGPQLRIKAGTTLGSMRPTVLFSDSLKRTLAGIPFVFYHAPGETPDQLLVWLPQQRVALCGDNLYKTFPNLYTIRGTAYRDVNEWKNSLDIIRYLHPDVLIPSHTEVLHGPEKVWSVLTDYRDAIQFVHDQTVRGMNQGLGPDALVQHVQLPEHLRQSPWLQEFYGKVSWSVRTVFDGYLGFFDGNPSTLLPLNQKERATRLEQLAGGKAKLEQQMLQAFKNKDYQWALELADNLMVLYEGHSQAKEVQIESLKQLGKSQSNPNARNYYLTYAKELEGMPNAGLIKPTPELLKEIPMVYFFKGMAVHLNAQKAKEVHKRVRFSFSDTGTSWMVEVRNGVAEIQPFDTGKPDMVVTVSEQVWKELAAKIRKPLPSFAKGELKIEGGIYDFVSFMRLFDLAEE